MNADSDLKLNKPQLSVDIDREKAAALGIDVEVIGRTLETLLGGRQVTRFKREGKQYDVMVQLEAKDRSARRTSPRSTCARATARWCSSRTSCACARPWRRRSSTTSTARARRSSRPTSRRGRRSARRSTSWTRLEKKFSPQPRTDLDGVSREFRESGAGLAFVILFAALFIYLMLSAQFESFVSPFVIMLTVPLAGLGALAAIWLTGGRSTCTRRWGWSC